MHSGSRRGVPAGVAFRILPRGFDLVDVNGRQRGLEFFEALPQTRHFLPRTPNRPNPVNRRLDETIDAGLDLFHPRGDRLLTDPDQIMEHIIGEEGGAPSSLFGDDLGERLRRDVIRRLVVDHANLLPTADPSGQFLERDVAALLGVVEFAATVALDESNHWQISEIFPDRPRVALLVETNAVRQSCQEMGTVC